MLLTCSASLRRLVLLATAVLLAATVFINLLQGTFYGEYLPGAPTLVNWRPSNDGRPASLSTHIPEVVQGSIASSAWTSPSTAHPGTVTTAPAAGTIAAPAPTAPAISSSSECDWEILTGDGHQYRICRTIATGEDTSATSSEDPDATPTLSPNGTLVDTIDTGALPKHMSYEETQASISALIKSWQPIPIEGHSPAYEEYRDKDYDPSLYEGFEWDNNYYINNGVKKLSAEPKVHLPYPNYSSPSYRSQWRGEYVPCEGARNKLLNDSSEDLVKAWESLPLNFPGATMGDGSTAGLDDAHGFDRYNRYGPYGHGQSEREAVMDWQRPIEKLDWPAVRWGQLQDQCVIANQERFAADARRPSDLTPGKEMPKPHLATPTSRGKAYHFRTAVLVRSWIGREYTEDDLQYLRAMITELSLFSGGEYQVYLLVDTKDRTADIWNDTHKYEDMLKVLPRELQGLSVLYNEDVFQEWYPQVGDWSVDWHNFMPLQWFSETHPEFDFVWNWELDTRYTGNHYEFLEGLSGFGRNLPRKYLWERNQRVYLPNAEYGTYPQFVENTIRTVETGMREGLVTPVWGPQPYDPAAQTPLGPTPPTSEKDDQFQLGRGEAADLITLNPMFNPKDTEWRYKDKIWNFIPDTRPHFTDADPEDTRYHHAEFHNVPRRASVGTTAIRFSRKQLNAMHVENIAGRAMAAEMWPATVALQHGLKAVYAPIPIYTSQFWPAWYADAVFNADLNRPAHWSSGSDSVYAEDRSANLRGLSFSARRDAGFATVLYRRWLGYAAYEDEPVSPLDGLGGRGYEESGYIVDLQNGQGGVLVGGEGRMCLPPMLLHPVRKTKESDEAGEKEFLEPGG